MQRLVPWYAEPHCQRIFIFRCIRRKIVNGSKSACPNSRSRVPVHSISGVYWCKLSVYTRCNMHSYFTHAQVEIALFDDFCMPAARIQAILSMYCTQNWCICHPHKPGRSARARFPSISGVVKSKQHVSFHTNSVTCGIQFKDAVPWSPKANQGLGKLAANDAPPSTRISYGAAAKLCGISIAQPYSVLKCSKKQSDQLCELLD